MNSNVGIAVSPFTNQQQSQEWSGEMWGPIKITLPLMKRASAAAWMAFFASLHGMAGTFMLGPTAMKSPLGAALGAPLVDGANNGGFTLATRGWTPNTPNILVAGDFFQIGNRLHMVIGPETSDAAGKAAFDIWPSIREVPGDGDVITLINPVGMFRLSSNQPAFDIDEAQIFSFSFEAIEAL